MATVAVDRLVLQCSMFYIDVLHALNRITGEPLNLSGSRGRNDVRSMCLENSIWVPDRIPECWKVCQKDPCHGQNDEDLFWTDISHLPLSPPGLHGTLWPATARGQNQLQALEGHIHTDHGQCSCEYPRPNQSSTHSSEAYLPQTNCP